MSRHSFRWLSPHLTWFGNKFGVDAHYFAKNSAIVMLGHAVTLLNGFLVGYLATLFFDPGLYGEYRFVLSVIGVISAIKLAGMPSAVAVSVVRDPNPPLWSAMKQYTCIALFGSLILLGTIFFLPYWHREDLWPLFLVAAVFFLPEAVGTTFFGGIVKGKALFARAFTVSVKVRILVIVAALLTYFLYPSPALLIAFTLGIPGILYLKEALKLLRKFSSRDTSTDVLKYGFNLSLATIPVSLAWYLDSLLISALFGLNQLAIFSVALLIPEQAKVLFKELLPVSFSKQSAGKDSMERRKKLLRIVLVMTFFSACGIAAYVLLCPYFIPFFFPHYPASEVIFLTRMAAIVTITSPATLFLQYLEAQKLLIPLRNSNWVAAAAFTVSLFILVPEFHLLGAILARGIFRIVLVGYPIVTLLIFKKWVPVTTIEKS